VPDRPASPDDHRRIEALIHRYAQLIDEGDFEGLGDLFTHGRIALEDGSVLAEGAEAVTALYRATTRLHDDGTPRTLHVTTNVIVELDAGATTAHARSYFTVLQQTPAVALQPIAAGRYRDRFERRGDAGPGGLGEWRFTERMLLPRFYGDVHDHLLIDLPQG
jgi:3-phenylpropionate/cinnamic acid dioxygenase small subunit